MTGRALGLVLIAALLQPGCARMLYNFGTVEQGKIYRAAQPSPLFLRWLVSRYEIKSLVNLRGRTRGFESDFAARHGLRLYSLDLSSRRPPTEAQVQRFGAIVGDPGNQPVLVHCRGGVDRSGTMIALYRIDHGGWTTEQALFEMNRFLQFEWMNPVPQRVVRDGLRGSGSR